MTDSELQTINARHTTLQLAASAMAEAVPRHSANTVALALLTWIEVALEHLVLPEDIDGELAANLAVLLAALRARSGSTGATWPTRSGANVLGTRWLLRAAAGSATSHGSLSLCGAVCRRLRRDAGRTAGRPSVHRHRPRSRSQSSVLRSPARKGAGDASVMTPADQGAGPDAVGAFQVQLAGGCAGPDDQ